MASTSVPPRVTLRGAVFLRACLGAVPREGHLPCLPKARAKQQSAWSSPGVKRSLAGSQPDLSGRKAGVRVVPTEQRVLVEIPGRKLDRDGAGGTGPTQVWPAGLWVSALEG